MRILIIEDELKLRILLLKGLREQGYTVMATESGEEGLEAVSACAFDTVILDIGLPGCNGYDVATRLRALGAPCSILMLTAYDTEDDIVRGLDLGADDYMRKPFSFQELLARLRRLRPESPQTTIGSTRSDVPILLDPARQRVMRAGEVIHLTRTEFLLFEHLAQRAGETVPRSELMSLLENDSRQLGKTALDTYMSSLRKKISPTEEQQGIQTIRGIGYCLPEAPEITKEGRH